jgi:hypothetical protein
MVNILDSDVLAKYQSWDGYVLGNPSSDQGGVLQNVLAQWRQASFIGCFCLDAYAAIHQITSGNSITIDPQEFKQAVWMMGGADVGIQCPPAWMSTQLWDVGSGPDYSLDNADGHCIWCIGYNATGPVFISWGQIFQMTWAAFAYYVDEAWAPVSGDWMRNNAAGISPSGFNLEACVTALDAIAA